MHDTILDVLLTERPRLTRMLQRRYSWSSAQAIDDAVSDAVVSALLRPAPFEQALDHDGRRGVCRMFHSVARRRHRDVSRRGVARWSVPEEALSCVGTPPGQVYALQLRQVGDLIDQASLRFGRGRGPRLRKALWVRFHSGDSDTAVARAFGLPREYLNRARCYVLDALSFEPA